MHLNRRQLLIGLGVIGAGGAGIGSLAFTAIDADRDVSVVFADDEDAILGMEAARDADNFAFEDDGVSGIGITIEQVNRNSKVRFDDLLLFTNNGTNDIDELTFEIIEENSVNGRLEIPDDSTSIGPLAVDDSTTGLALIIEARESVDPSFDGKPDIDATIRISATTDV